MRFFITDVFGKDKYSGNKLAVFLDNGVLSGAEMQQIASEINFSETTFITSINKKENAYPVRIFTPKSEINFAGHPTLGTAYIIKKYIEKNNSDQILLEFKAGKIPVNLTENIIWMKQNQPEYGKFHSSELFQKILNLSSTEFDHRFPILEVSTGLAFTIVPLTSLIALKKIKINLEYYNSFIENAWAKGILVFCPEGYTTDQQLAVRVFVNYLGIPEDPATGSANGCLLAYLLKNNFFNSNQSISFSIGQGYEINRPSELFLKGNLINNIYELTVGGNVIEIAEGNWLV